MTENHHEHDLFQRDEFDERLALCKPVEPPSYLRMKIRRSLPQDIVPRSLDPFATAQVKPSLARRFPIGHLQAGNRWLRNHRLRYAAAACAAALAFQFFFLNRTETPAAAEPWDVLVAAAQASAEVDALHITVFAKYEQVPLSKGNGMQEQWWLRNVGYASVTKTLDGEVRAARAQRPTVKQRYSSITNEYVIEPVERASQLAWDFTPPPIYFDVNQEQNFVAQAIKAATEQGIRIDVVELTMDGRKVKRMSVDEVNLAPPETIQDLIYSVVVEIDVTTNHIIRTRTRMREVIKPEYEKDYGENFIPGSNVMEKLYEYPSPGEFDLSVFELEVPDGAIVRRLEFPSWLLKDRDRLLVIGVFIEQYLVKSNIETEGNGSYPKDFVAALEEMENFPDWYLYPGATFGGVDRSKTYWTFFHAGEKGNDLINEGELLSTSLMKTVIAEKRYESGHLLQLFADGDVRITPPEKSENANDPKD